MSNIRPAFRVYDDGVMKGFVGAFKGVMRKER